MSLEKDLRGFIAWCNEFVGSVHDNSGNSLKGDFDQFLTELEAQVNPKPLPRVERIECNPKSPCARQGLQCVYLRGDDVCINCGWAR